MSLVSLWKHIRPLVVASLLLSMISSARATELLTQKALSSLEDAVRGEIAKKSTAQRAAARGDERISPVETVAQVRAAIAGGNSAEAERMLNYLSAFSRPNAVADKVASLRKAIRADRERNDQPIIAKLDNALSLGREAVHRATTPAQLDNTMRELFFARELNADRASEAVREKLKQVQNANQFVIYWQDYLASREGGDLKSAIQSLQSASGLPEGLLPRSMILTAKSELTQALNNSAGERMAEVIAKTKMLDDLAPAIEALSASERQRGGFSDEGLRAVTALKAQLVNLARVHAEFRAGFPSSLQLRSNGNIAEQQAFRATQELRLVLVRLIIPRLLGLDQAPAPTPDEPIEAYLDRVSADAAARLDARLIVRIQLLRDQLIEKSHPEFLPVLQPLLAAQNQEAAGEYAAAVLSYQLALKTGSHLVPAKAVGERLAAIKAAHPAAYEEGQKQFLRTWSTQYPHSYQPTGSNLPVPGATSSPPPPAR